MVRVKKTKFEHKTTLVCDGNILHNIPSIYNDTETLAIGILARWITFLREILYDNGENSQMRLTWG
jgi:hypothetical protein